MSEVPYISKVSFLSCVRAGWHDPPSKAASDQGLHCLPLIPFFNEILGRNCKGLGCPTTRVNLDVLIILYII